MTIDALYKLISGQWVCAFTTCWGGGRVMGETANQAIEEAFRSNYIHNKVHDK
jgi:hypothetical protein